MSSVLLDAAGRRRSPVTMPGFLSGRPPRNKGRRYPADPPTVEEIVAVMRQAGTTPHGLRMRGLIVVLWRAGLRICEALALTEADLDARRGAVLVRRGKGGRRREVGMDDWAWEQLQHWAERPRRAARRSAVLHPDRTDPRPRLVAGRRPRTTAPHGSARRRPPPIRATPAPPRPRRRDGARGRAADRHPTPARTHQPRHHLHLPARHRQRRNYRHRPRPPPARRAGQQHAAALTARPLLVVVQLDSKRRFDRAAAERWFVAKQQS
jgi:integrase